MITVAAPRITAVLIDRFGLFTAPHRSINAGRAVGFALTVAGMWLVVRG